MTIEAFINIGNDSAGGSSKDSTMTAETMAGCSGSCSKVQVFLQYQGKRIEEYPCANVHDLAQPSTSIHQDSLVYNYAFAGTAGVSVVVASAHRARGCDRCKEAFARAFCIPDFWWDESCKRANGFFGFKDIPEAAEETERLGGCASWSRLQVKSLWQDERKPGGYGYAWDKLDTFSRSFSSTGHTAVILFQAKRNEADAHEVARKAMNESRFQKSLLKPAACPAELKDPFWIYPRLLRVFMDLANASVWETRTLVRDRVEKVREKREERNSREKGQEDTDEPEPLNPDYSLLHDIARHVIHVSETLTVGAVTIQSMLKQHEMHCSGTVKTSTTKNIGYCLSMWHHLMTSNLQRSEANRARLRNEISLAFNQVSQEDSYVSVQLAKDTRLDSAAMRTIAFVTMVFLPATFISAIFSTSFFNFSPETGRWLVSDQFYIYWICAGSVTAAMIGLWFWKRDWFEPEPIKTGKRPNPSSTTRQRQLTYVKSLLGDADTDRSVRNRLSNKWAV